jgi:hypothetical protein
VIAPAQEKLRKGLEKGIFFFRGKELDNRTDYPKKMKELRRKYKQQIVLIVFLVILAIFRGVSKFIQEFYID